MAWLKIGENEIDSIPSIPADKRVDLIRDCILIG